MFIKLMRILLLEYTVYTVFESVNSKCTDCISTIKSEPTQEDVFSNGSLTFSFQIPRNL